MASPIELSRMKVVNCIFHAFGKTPNHECAIPLKKATSRMRSYRGIPREWLTAEGLQKLIEGGKLAACITTAERTRGPRQVVPLIKVIRRPDCLSCSLKSDSDTCPFSQNMLDAAGITPNVKTSISPVIQTSSRSALSTDKKAKLLMFRAEKAVQSLKSNGTNISLPILAHHTGDQTGLSLGELKHALEHFPCVTITGPVVQAIRGIPDKGCGECVFQRKMKTENTEISTCVLSDDSSTREVPENGLSNSEQSPSVPDKNYIGEQTYVKNIPEIRQLTRTLLPPENIGKSGHPAKGVRRG